MEKVAIMIILIAFTIIILLGITLSSIIWTFGLANAQVNKANQTTASKQASQSIRDAITDTGKFLNNATQKLADSKSAQTIVNESSDVLGNATVATKKFLSPK